MLQARRWTGQAIEADGVRVELDAENVSTHEGKVSIVFPGVERQPLHVLVRWNGSSILSVTDMETESEKLLGNPGRVVWEEESGKLYFIANEAELSEVCASQFHGDKFSGSV